MLMKIIKDSYKENISGYLFIAPQILLFLVFLVNPIIDGIRLSLFKISYQDEVFIGFENYRKLFSDPVFVQSTINTVIFVVCIVALTVVFALFVASAVFDKNAKYVSFIRGAYYIPVMVSMVVMSMIWSFLLNPANGLIPFMAREMELSTVNFLGDPKWVLPVIIFVTFATNGCNYNHLILRTMDHLLHSFYQIILPQLLETHHLAFQLISWSTLHLPEISP